MSKAKKLDAAQVAAEVAVPETKSAEDKAKKAVKTAEAKAKKAVKAAETKVKKDVKAVETKAKKAAKAVKVTTFVQFAGMECSVADVEDKAKAAFKAQHKRTAVKSMTVYVKPEDHAAYYVVNDEFTGKVEL